MATKTINTVLNLRDKFSSKLKKASDNTKQNSRQMKVLNNHVDGFKQRAVGGFGAAAKAAVGVGVAIGGIALAASGITSSIDFVKDYSSSMTNMQAATGATTEEMKAMKGQITDLYKLNMGESWSDLANAMTTAKQVTGQVGDELKQTTSLAVTYRDVFGEDVSESIKVADTMMKNFGISSTEAYNLLAQGAQNGLNKAGDLLDTANEYSVYFNNLGYSANEMFDVLGSGLAEGAFNADKVADAMKEFGIKSKDGSKTSMEGFQALGLSGEKMTAAFAEGGPAAKKAFGQVMAAMEKIEDPAKKNAASVNLFGTQAEDMEKDVIAALGSARKQFDMTKNTMEGINQVKYENPLQAMKGIGRMIETSVLIPISDRLMPKLSEFGQWFKDHSPEIEAAIQEAFTKGAKVIDGFKDSIAWAKDNADWLIPVIGGLTAAIAAQKIVGTISGLFKTWTAVTKGMTVAQIALNVAAAANPFGLIAIAIGAVIGVGIALWKNWDTVKLKAQQLGGMLKGVGGGIKTFIVNTVSSVGNWLNSFPLGQQFLETVRGVVSSTKQIFGGITKFLKSVFKGDWDGAWNGIVESFSGTFSLIKTYAKAPINAIIEMINGLIDKVNSISVDIPEWMGGGTFGVSIPKIPKFALGTSYFKGGLAQINERGGEIVNLPGGSQVIPADKSEKMINASRGPIKIEIIIQGNVIGEEEYVNQLMNKAVSKLEIALGNV
ncbi:phage tail tape measure protein [Paenibacillus glucanolyticus]|uniref:phage tail tape measure protein n=1 Tax=Paenibacillus glucanolyticus TaxID=59843 RepID=UPI0030D3F100